MFRPNLVFFSICYYLRIWLKVFSIYPNSDSILIDFSDKLIYTNAFAYPISYAMLFLLKSTDFNNSSLNKLTGIYLTILFLILKTWRSAMLMISSGIEEQFNYWIHRFWISDCITTNFDHQFLVDLFSRFDQGTILLIGRCSWRCPFGGRFLWPWWRVFSNHLFFGLNILNYNVDMIIMGTIKEFIPFSLKDL